MTMFVIVRHDQYHGGERPALVTGEDGAPLLFLRRDDAITTRRTIASRFTDFAPMTVRRTLTGEHGEIVVPGFGVIGSTTETTNQQKDIAA